MVERVRRAARAPAAGDAPALGARRDRVERRSARRVLTDPAAPLRDLRGALDELRASARRRRARPTPRRSRTGWRWRERAAAGDPVARIAATVAAR